MDASLSRYGGGFGLAAASVWIGILLLTLLGSSMTGVGPAAFLAWGPNEEARIAGIPVDTWPKWCLVMLYSGLSQIAQSIVETTVEPFITNEIRDPESSFQDETQAQLVVGLSNFFHWVVALFDILIYITLQFQFYTPAIIADLAVNGYITRGNMLRKREPSLESALLRCPV